MVRVENISFAYQDHSVLKNISVGFEPGLFHAILGSNGSGKTTFLDIISGYAAPDTGTVFLDQTPLQTLPRRAVGRTVSLVSQSYEINFPFSVYEVVLMGRHPFMDRFSQPGPGDIARAEKAMEMTGLSGLKDCRVTELSGGEKQRCVFARAMCQDTPLLLLDEAFSNMDISHTLSLLQVLRQEMDHGHKTVIAVLHDLNLAAAWAHKLYFFKAGQLIAHGPTDQIFNSKNIRSAFDVTAKVAFNEHLQAKQAVFLP